jgi:hypothetical protein
MTPRQPISSGKLPQRALPPVRTTIGRPGVIDDSQPAGMHKNTITNRQKLLISPQTKSFWKKNLYQDIILIHFVRNIQYIG